MNKKKSFTKGGKKIDSTSKGINIQPAASIFMDIETEQVSSLWESNVKKPTKKLIFPQIKSITTTLTRKVSQIDTVVLTARALGVIAALTLTIGGIMYFSKKPVKIIPNIDQYSVFSSKPLQMDSTQYNVYTRDSRSQRLNNVFKKYNCPLEGMGELFVQMADENEIPWWIVASIAFQESSCGKNTPTINGIESYNAWGWAVYGENVHKFDNWARGIETVSKYLSKRFFSQGITDTCEIMETYTPPSNGSWCEGVNHFRDLFINYKTPDTINL